MHDMKQDTDLAIRMRGVTKGRNDGGTVVMHAVSLP